MTLKNTGKLGIGTTAPAAKLHIEGDGQYATIRGYSQILDLGNWTNGEIRIESTGAPFHLRAAGNQPIHLETNNVERISILGTGNVGIGTTSPEGRLMVEVTGANATPPIKINRGLDGGRIQLQYSGNETGYGEIGQMYAGTGRTQIWIGANLNSFSTGHNSAPTQHDVNYASWFGDWDSYRDRFTIGRIASGTASSLMVINSSGNVGIGTTSPNAKLELNVPTGNGLLIKSADVATIKMKGSGGVTDWGFATTYLAAGDFGIYASNSAGGDPISAGTAKMYFTSSGNVGIGTTSPAHKLQVVGNAMLSTSDGFMYLSNVGVNNAGIYVRGRATQGTLRSHTTTDFRWEIGGSEKAILNLSLIHI